MLTPINARLLNLVSALLKILTKAETIEECRRLAAEALQYETDEVARLVAAAEKES